jgi:hypothetical protein
MLNHGASSYLALYRHILRISKKLGEHETLYIRDLHHSDTPNINYSMSGAPWQQ